MKATLLALLSLTSITLAGESVVVPPTPSPSPVSLTELENLGKTILNSGGLAIAVYPSVMLGTLSEGSKATDRYGFGVAGFYPVSQYAFVGGRIDWISGKLWAPSATIGARYTVDKLPFKPTFFTMGGLVYTVSGAGVDTHSVGAITGLGAIVNLKHSQDGNFTLDAFIEGEKWTNLPGEILHFGLAGGLKF
jgi:hypothetical protein